MAVARRNWRRLTGSLVRLVFIAVSLSLARVGAGAPGLCRRRRRHRRGAVDGFADTQIRTAAAEIAVHRRVDVSVTRIGRLLEQSRRRHQLTRLTVAALRN